MKKKFLGIKSVFLREIGIIIKDIDLIALLLISPIFYSFFYGSFYMYKTENNVPIVVVDYDHSALSRTLIRNLDSHQLIEVKEEAPDFATAQDKIYKLEDQGIVYIPKGFEANLKSGHGTDLKVFLNTTKFLISNDLNKAITEVIEYLGAGVRLKYYEANGYSFEQAKELVEPLKGDVRPLFNIAESYGYFLIPGVLILILQQTLLFGFSQSIAKEREEKSLADLYKTSNYSMFAMLTGKSLFYFLLYSAYALFFYTISFSVFKINFLGDFSALAVLTALLLICVLNLSIIVASFFKNKITALMVLVFTSYPIFFISGYSWPYISLPLSLKLLSNLMPLTPFYNAYIRITQMGAGWPHIWPELIHLLILVLISLIAARIRMKILIKHSTNEPVVSPIFTISSKWRNSF